MKYLLTFALMTLSFSLYACPNISGTFHDAKIGMVRNITQEGCSQTTWSDETGEITFITDGLERIIQKNGETTAYAKAHYLKDSIIIDIRMDWGTQKNDVSLPTRWLTVYKIASNNNLVEKISPFNKKGIELGTDFVAFKRLN